MALRLRRGTDAERLTIIPQEGELIYTIDTKELYAGDGTTVGGNRISGSTDGSPAQLTQNLNLNSNNITGTGNIDINGFVTADFNGGLIGDVLGDIQGSVFANNSTLLVDALDGIIFAENVRGEFTGNVIGDIKGSVFGDDSSIIVDAVNNILTAESATVDILTTDEVRTSNQELEFTDSNGPIQNFVKLSNIDLSADNSDRGKIYFSRNDINGKEVEAIIGGGRGGVYFIADNDTGTFPEANTVLINNSGNTGFGTYSPAEKLDVRGNAVMTGFVQFGSLTTTARNALTAAAGMVIWNSTTTQFEGYNGTNWINLVDGVTST